MSPLRGCTCTIPTAPEACYRCGRFDWPAELPRNICRTVHMVGSSIVGEIFMDPELLFYSLTRILHVGTAIVVVGGTFFLRFVLFPAATQNLSDDVHARLRGA